MFRRLFSLRPFLLLVAFAALLAGAVPALAADLRPGWGAWWLPPVRSTHGEAIDSLFMVTFWITMVTFVAVELCQNRYGPQALVQAVIEQGSVR